MSLQGKVALVAGGTGGLGKAVSLALAKAGAKVAVTYRADAEFAALQSQVQEITGFKADVTDEKAVLQLVEELVAKSGRIDILVNSVGGYAGGTKLWELDTPTFEKMYAMNLRSGYALVRAVAPHMIKQKQGAIVNVGAKAAFDHAAGASAYASSKAAALAMLDSLAEDLRGTGVRANTILPSIIDTETNRKVMPKSDFSKWPKPDDIAKVVLFLCSDDSRVIHGAAIPVYGSS